MSNQYMSGGWTAVYRLRASSLLLLTLAALLLVAACRGEEQEPVDVEGGDPERGVEQIYAYGCGECHLIPDIEGADGGDAPGLQIWANRAVVAGGIPNTPENVIEFIQNPAEVQPGTQMPDLGVSEQDARDITAYLFTLR